MAAFRKEAGFDVEEFDLGEDVYGASVRGFGERFEGVERARIVLAAGEEVDF